jgi:hypothetical protein
LTKQWNVGAPLSCDGCPVDTFLVDINDIVVDHPIPAPETLKSDINKISLWADKWLVKFNLNP